MENIKIDIKCTPLSHLCHVNEVVEFEITADQQIPLEAVISIDGETVLEKHTVTSPAKLKASLPFPGFLRCTVSAGEVKKECAVGVDPDQIRPLKPEPEDFDEFWAEAFRKLEAIPEDFRMTPCEGIEGFDIFRIECANVNSLRAYALLAIPQEQVREGKKAPLRVMFGGGEAYVSEEGFREMFRHTSGKDEARYAYLFFHLPPYPPAQKQEDARARHDEFLESIGLRRYIFYKMDSRETYYAYPAILGSLRLLNITADMPEINKDVIVYSGSSHGGGFGLYFCCFSKLIKAAFCGVPNFGDIAGVLAGRHQPDSNSPEWRGNDSWKIRQYFDTSYCARRITCPVYISVGFVDWACAPTAVYAIYNNLAGPRMIFNKIENGHGDAPPEYAPMYQLWLKEQLKALEKKQ